MRDKVPFRSSTGTEEGDVVRKGHSADRREPPVLATARRSAANTFDEDWKMKRARSAARGAVRVAGLAAVLVRILGAPFKRDLSRWLGTDLHSHRVGHGSP